MRAPLCQSCALVEQVFISLFSLSACLALCGPVTDEPSHREEHQVCSHRRWPPKALSRYNHVTEIWIHIFRDTEERKCPWNLLGVWWVCEGKHSQSLTLFLSVHLTHHHTETTFSLLMTQLLVSTDTKWLTWCQGCHPFQSFKMCSRLYMKLIWIIFM